MGLGELRREWPGEEDRLDTLHCTLQTYVVCGIDGYCLDIRRLQRLFAAWLHQDADGNGTVGELGDDRLTHMTRPIRHKQHFCTVT